ncbi:2-keto-4-pentenoate hydratase/2-oxohepta-3-ene-1,7-dioic acid hydratase in catechol pathway [Bacillus ectoiniformans]|uniref:fumarylacetoacetate hydrolase family protein n=1 Tax=Bacillus ectoiniformans TaxID=1494429 RepID=UPI00195CC550|nr:fumarylacetoacetate hydrolase family protein [Bacillus ectoiniformans]MBM7647573.1 2-keto-4-pentenoate hydratase/2-oxohepta-3-ene-1,7-dioic acid hydratase in catechol pathway [Bacillus ectoiniformans]
MKLISYLHNEEEKYGVYDEQASTVYDVQSMSLSAELPHILIEAIATGNEWVRLIQEWLESADAEQRQAASVPNEEVKWLAPIPRPSKNVMCIGKNYRDHAVEMGGEESIPTDLMVFTKSPTAVIADKETIPAYTDLTDFMDYEGELGVIIGKRGKEINQGDALDYVFGYTIINDVTARDIQKRHKQFFLGKSLDGTCPMGPWIVTKDEIDHPGNLSVETKVNGEVRQQSNTEYFIFPIDEIIATLSKGMTLEPGDVIATGTPAGVGFGMNPQSPLKSGDTIEITIEKVGTLTNKVQ